MPGIPINELATLDRPMENNDLNTYFPVVYTNGITYKSTINKIFFDGAVKTNVISDSAVTNIKISDNAITSTKISNNSITTNKIDNDAITSEKLNSQAGSEAVTADVIRNGAITTAKLDNTIGSEAVTTDVIRNGAITTAKLNTTSFEQAVSTETIRNCAVTTDKLNRAVGNEAVTTDTIRAGAVTPSKTSFLNNNISINDTNILISNGIKFNSVTPTGNICVKNTGEISIKPGVVTSSEIAANAVTTDKILDGSVTPAKLSQASVGTGNICNNAVGTSQLADNSVTTSILNKTANNQAVTTDTIRDAAVTSSKIATGAVITESISDYNVTTVKIQDGGVTTRKIATGAIGSNEIASGAVIGSKIPDNTIDNNKINNSCNYTINGLTITSPNLGINNVGYKFPSSATDGRFLQHTSGGNLEWVLPSNFEPQAGAVVLNKVLPVGTILPYSSTTLPEDGKFLPCDGTERLINDFPELAAILGNTYGDPSSSGKFKLPNLNGRVPIGNGTGNDGTDSCTFTIGGTGGKYNHTLCIAEMPWHSHQFNVHANYGYKDVQAAPAKYIAGQCHGTPIGPADSTLNNQNYITACGGSGSHNNIQPYTVTKYIIKAIPDEVIQYNMNIGPGLSALNASGGQTANINLSSSEIGLKVTDDFQFDGSGRLTLNDNVSASSITFDDGTMQTTGEPTAYYGVMVSNDATRTTPAQMRADRANANFYGAWDEYSKGLINTGYNNSGYPSTNSLMYTMHVNVLQNTVVTMYNFNNDDYFYIYQDDVLLYTGSNYASAVPRVVTFGLTAGIRRIDIVKNDSGGGSNSFELMGNIIGTNVRFISGY
jgi:microcystin-dependent protein